jgi:molybdopterin-guanine dinucleotide biosynthesis protein A
LAVEIVDGVAGVILAGGAGSRLGGNKALLELGGMPLVQHTVDALGRLVDTMVIVGSCPRETSVISEALVLPARCEGICTWDGARIAEGHAEGEAVGRGRLGPLAGIRAGLAASPHARCIVVGCDMPFLSVALLRYMATESLGFQAAVPRLGPRAALEPMCAVYSQSCIAHIDAMLAVGPRKVTGLFDLVRTLYVERAACELLDPGLLCFFNVNTREDLIRAEATLRLSCRPV